MIKEAMEIMLAFFWKQIDDEYSFGDISRISSASALGMSIEEKYYTQLMFQGKHRD